MSATRLCRVLFLKGQLKPTNSEVQDSLREQLRKAGRTGPDVLVIAPPGATESQVEKIMQNLFATLDAVVAA